MFSNKLSYVAILGFTAIIITAGMAHAETIIVNSTADVEADDGVCTLREAIVAANTNTISTDTTGTPCAAGDDVDDTIVFDAVVFDPAATTTITSLSKLPDIQEATTITGPGASALTIEGDGTQETLRVNDPDSPGDGATVVTISGLTITNGGDGGVRVNEGDNLTIMDCVITGNTSDNNEGAGGISAFGATVTIDNCEISGNTGDNEGGGVFVEDGDVVNTAGSLTILNGSLIDDNTNTNDSGGGVRITDASSMVLIQDSTISNNHALMGGGGGIAAFEATVTVENSTVSGNEANDGGGILNDMSASMTITNTTIAGNEALVGAGIPEGGGIDNEGGAMLTLANSTIFDNDAERGGGIMNDDAGTTATITNSTISGNRALENGGGIYNDNGSGTVTLVHSTVTLNTSDSDNSTDGNGGGISIPGGTDSHIILNNSIIANNTDNTGGAPDCDVSAGTGSELQSVGNSLLGDDTGCPDNDFDTDPGVKNDQLNVDPLLAALSPADGGDPANGGLTGVHVPLDMSPVIDAVDEAISPAEAKDQHGRDRPQGAAADIGAVEAGCGDGELQDTEECDDGAANSDVDPDACRSTCVDPSCGDNVIDTGEECDDGNTDDGDGCAADCTDETGGSGVCGDGVLDTGEECDDGNTDDGDGCAADCTDEAGSGGGCSLTSTTSSNRNSILFLLFAATTVLLRLRYRRSEA